MGLAVLRARDGFGGISGGAGDLNLRKLREQASEGVRGRGVRRRPEYARSGMARSLRGISGGDADGDGGGVVERD